MGKLKLIAKSYLLGDTFAVLSVFVITLTAIVFSGDFSFIITSLLELAFSNFRSLTGEKEQMLKIILSVVGIVLFIIITPPLKLGVERWFFFRAAGEKTTVKDVFRYFGISLFLRGQMSFWYASIIKSAVFIFFQFPALCVLGVLYSSAFVGEASFAILLSLFITGVILSLIGLSFYFLYSENWFMYYYIIVANETIKLSKAYKYSEGLMKKSHVRVCAFKLSFAPWWLLCIFIFPAFYVWGYYKQSMAVLAYRNEYLK